MIKIKQFLMILLLSMITVFAYADVAADIAAAGVKGAAVALLAVASVLVIITTIVGFNTIIKQLKKT